MKSSTSGSVKFVVNKFGSSNTFYPSASDGYRTSEDRLRDKRRSSRDESDDELN